MITRGRGRFVPTLERQVVYGCSTGDSSGWAGADMTGLGTVLVASGGAIVDLKAYPERYAMAEPYLQVYSTIGTTEQSKKLKIEVRLQHGASSAGGDMADLSTGSTGSWPQPRTLFSTAQTTTMSSWSTSPIMVASNPGAYDLGGANRYLRLVGNITYGTSGYATSTSTAGSVDNFYVTGGIRLGNGSNEPSAVDACSTSTSTST